MEKNKQDWIFTFGFGQKHQNCYTVFYGTFESAREKMFKAYGDKWAWQYESEDAAGVRKFNLKKIRGEDGNKS